MKRYSIAIDLGGTNIKAAVISRQSSVISRQSIPTRTYKNKNALINGLSKLSLEIIQSLNIKKSEVAGIGIGIPGLVDSEKGVVYHITNIKGFNNVPFKKLIERRTGIPVFLDNDVNIMTLGELYHGAGRGAKNMVCITLGTGVGGGIIIDGELYRGSSLSAGEIGHMPLNETGPKCNCGGNGCMEKYVGNRYIVDRTIEKIKTGEKTLITKLVNGDLRKITPEQISLAAKKGDKLAVSIWEEIGGHLGVTLAGVINFVNPERIVIGGGVAEAGPFLFEPLKKTIRKRAMKVPAGCAKIVKAKLGQDAGLIGAAVLVKLAK